MRAAGVGIADVIHAIAVLRPNRAAIETLVAMCGLALVPDRVVSPAVAETDDDATEAALDLDAPLTNEMPSQSLPPSVTRLKPVRQDAIPPPTTDPLVGPAAVPPVATPEFEGLLTVRDGAELLRLAVSVPMSTDKIDVGRVANEFAHARPLTEMPYLPVPSLALGAQVLVDVGDSMQPFLEDQQQLLRRFETNLRRRADIRYFADDPARGTGPSRRRGSWGKEYAPPRPGSPVIALTDLGCGFPRRHETARAWLAFGERLQRRESRLVVFAPVRLARIPQELRRTIDLVLWDRSAIGRNVMQLVEVSSD